MKSSLVIAGLASRFSCHRGPPADRIRLRLIGALVVGVGMLLTGRSSPAATLVAAAPLPAAHASPMPFYLEKNVGQAPRGVRFLAHAGSEILSVTDRGGVIGAAGRSLIRMTPLGGALHPQLVPADKLPGIINYFLGNNRRHWYTNVPTYGEVTYRNVYPGIDLSFHGQGERLEYDWIVKPGADLGRIHLAVGGASTPAIDARGVLHFGNLPILETRPTIYQQLGGARRRVQGGYALAGGSTVRFRVGQYDRSRPLVIDPVIQFSEYLGGSGDDFSNAVKVDAKGHIYIDGETKSADLPLRNAYQKTSHGGDDMFVQKLTSSGGLMYGTYIGGSDSDGAEGIAVDGAGRAYVAGWTDSANFPVVPQATFLGSPAAVVLSLNAKGNVLRYSMVYGDAGTSYAQAIAVDPQGDAYAAIAVTSPGGKSDPWVRVLKVGRNGPNDPATTEGDLGLNSTGFAFGIAVTKSGNVVVVGTTSTSDFAIYKAAQPAYGGGFSDGFVTEFDSNLDEHLVFSTYLGGSDPEHVNAVAVDGSNNIYIAGGTLSANFPATNVFDVIDEYSPFVTKLSGSGKLLYSTVIGSPVNSTATGIVVNKQGYATIDGTTGGSWLFMKNPLKGQGSYRGGQADGFVATLGGAGQRILFSSYLGGSALDDVTGIAIGGAGNLFATGSTLSANFPKTRGQRFNASGNEDAFLTKIGTHK